MGPIIEELINQGKAEGVLLGKAEGKAESLTLLLQRRFGLLDEPVLTRIAAASLEGLDSGYLAALSERPLSEVLERLGPG